MSNLTIEIPDSLRRDLEQVCEQQQRAIDDVVRDSLRRYVAVAKFHALRRRALPFAEAQGLLTDEDVFKAIS